MLMESNSYKILMILAYWSLQKKKTDTVELKWLSGLYKLSGGGFESRCSHKDLVTKINYMI